MYFFMARSEPTMTTESRTAAMTNRYRQLYNAVHDKNNAKFRCFGCLHVRTATMAMGTYNLILQTLGVVFLLSAVMQMQPEWSNVDERHARLDMAPQLSTWNETSGAWQVESSAVDTDDELSRDYHGQRPKSPRLPLTPLSQFKYVKDYTNNMNRSRMNLIVLGLMFLMAMTLALLYGVLYRRPLLILPFFMFQVFDFVSGCFTIVNHQKWLPQLHRMIEANSDDISPTMAAWLPMAIFVGCVFVLIAKAYMIGVVWSCYQYTMVLYAMAHSQHHMPLPYHRSDDDLLYRKPPAYEDCTDMVPPPAYASTVEPTTNDQAATSTSTHHDEHDRRPFVHQV